MSQNHKKFLQNLAKTKTEEDVKNVYAKNFSIAYDTSDRHDLYTSEVLFEFKYLKNFQNTKNLSTVLAQTLYYAHRLKYGFTKKAIPVFLCLADSKEAIITKTIEWKEYYTNEKYDWDLAPSIPDKKLIEDLSKDKKLKDLHIFEIANAQDYAVFEEKLIKCLDPQQKFDFIDKKIITEKNFEEVFEYWNGIFGTSVKNGFKTSKYFVCDIQEGRSILMSEQGKVFFDFGKGEGRTKKILLKDYKFFWQLYERVTKPDIIRGIISKIDRLTNEEMRRFHGEFFTPIRFAQKALEYIEKTLGKEWWKTGEYRIWDMAAGTGNLEWYLPNDAYPYLYLSSLYDTDVEHCERLFSQATTFQYDYLNDDIANIFANGSIDYQYTWKLPQKLRDDLSNPKIKWLIFINPPFATSQTAGLHHGNSKQDVSNTLLRKVMHKQGLGEVSRELFSQFVFRIKKEFNNKIAHFGLFSKLSYIVANNDQKLRDKIFQFQFEKGFMFSSATFSGTSKNSPFPVGFLLWDLTRQKSLEKQKIKLDIFNEDLEKIGNKRIGIISREKFLNKWIKRPPATIKFPPLGSAINVKAQNKDRRDRITEDFLASFMCAGNDFQHQNNTALLSAPYVSAGALSVTPENFEKTMVVHVVRRIPKATWLNDRDQFLKPNKNLSQEFINDCMLWNLFSNSNQTVAMKDVEYEKEMYQIQNHFFPFRLSELKKWKITDSDFVIEIASAEERFVAKHLKKQKLSKEAKAVLEAGEALYQFYFANLHQLRTPLFEIKTWDAGFWQIRKALQEQNLGTELFEKLKEKHQILREKLLPQIYEYGFISKIEIN